MKYQPVRFKGDIKAESDWYLFIGGITIGFIFTILAFYAFDGWI